jgi:hypothetical protein
MLAEFGLIHDVFARSSHSTLEVCDLRLRALKEVLLNRGLVRNFRNGEWLAFFTQHEERWDRRAKELVKKLVEQRRLLSAPPTLSNSPTNGIEWCREAVASNRSDPLTGIIATRETASMFPEEQRVSAIEKLDQTAWWRETQESLRLKRQTTEYLKHLALVLKSANSVMFIDPYIDPTRAGYSEFHHLLLAVQRRDRCPVRIQIHRVCCRDRGPGRSIPTEQEWRESFSSLDKSLANAGRAADVYFWDDFHDRYLITDQIGILMANGFDVSRNPQESPTTWSRISREDRTAIQRDFDYPNNVAHELRFRFCIGKLK